MIYFRFVLQIISSMVMCIVSAIVTSLVILSAVFGLHFDTFASYYFSYNKEVLSYASYLKKNVVRLEEYFGRFSCKLIFKMIISVIFYSHRTGTGLGQVQGKVQGPNELYKNVHTGPKQGKEPGLTVSCCAG